MRNNQLFQEHENRHGATRVAMALFSTTLTGRGFAKMSPRRLMVQ
jgi:hypothetical protein